MTAVGDVSRAAVLEAPRRFEVAARPRPRPGPGEALVRIAATAVCHTDLAIYAGRHPGVRYPVVPGHEAAGVVEAVAPEARVTVGTRVVINPIIACGACDCCLRGQDNLCRRAGLLGRELDGSLAEHVVLPERYLHPLPAHIGLETATLIETLATVRHAQQRVSIGPADAVVVLGQGTTGLLHTRLATLSGANPVIAVSRSAWKRDLARRMRADATIDPAGSDMTAQVLGLTGGRGADVVIDTAGDPRLLRPAIEMLRPGGTLLLYAISQEPVPDFTTFPMYYKELSLVGSRALVPADFEPAIRLVATGAVDLEGFITGSYPLHRTAAAFGDYERDPDHVLRILIVP
ncbi:MAG TPA: alcohol dehydrogenase catalytic domain-containing protein [Methylomirabilota bacterium]|nr:alcohol dehydrogenase catalytic domain-containing protein [Methylomirabilota bacterium]